tara:strand:+ start:3295 stop:3471 length:177 start_codon:yes stop_codon:yes gene_type:complete
LEAGLKIESFEKAVLVEPVFNKRFAAEAKNKTPAKLNTIVLKNALRVCDSFGRKSFNI